MRVEINFLMRSLFYFISTNNEGEFVHLLIKCVYSPRGVKIQPLLQSGASWGDSDNANLMSHHPVR